MKRIITQTDKDAFLEFYFGWRAEGKNIRECYRLARQAYIAEGHDSVPSFSTLRRWLYPNMSKKVKMTAGAESEEAGRKDMKAIAAAATDRSEIYRALLRAYRLRREEDIDGLVDLIAPEVTA